MVAPNARYSPFEAIANRQRDIGRNQENSSRLAISFGSFSTVGWGEVEHEERIDFEVAYLHEPYPSHGSALYEDEADKIRPTRFPRCWGTVSDWDIDAGGLYRGCWVVTIVEDRSYLQAPTDPDPNPEYHIKHTFTFMGVALKPIATYTGKAVFL